jgi:Mg2+/Co2+ transporter CorC
MEIGTSLEDILIVVKAPDIRDSIYQGVLDNVVGILHGKDLMPYVHYPKTFRLVQLLRKPVFIPDTARSTTQSGFSECSDAPRHRCG